MPPLPLTPAEAAVAREIVRLAREVLRLEGAPPAEDEPLAGTLDSLALLGLVVAVEDRFRVVLTDDDAAGARTLADLARIVAARAPPDRVPGEVTSPPQPRSAGHRSSGDKSPPQPRSAGHRSSGDKSPPQPRSAGHRDSGDKP